MAIRCLCDCQAPKKHSHSGKTSNVHMKLGGRLAERVRGFLFACFLLSLLVCFGGFQEDSTQPHPYRTVNLGVVMQRQRIR